MSSHREAPESSKDPVADSTDVYAFVNAGSTVTLIANYIPFEAPDGGPNFFEFANDVLYSINVDNDGDGMPDISYQFQFTTVDTPAASEFFLYNTGQIAFANGAYTNWSRPQTYTLTRVDHRRDRREVRTILGQGLVSPPCNIGPLSTPDYPSLVTPAIHNVTSNGHRATVFAGQRGEGFYVDLGALFDLGNLRPFEQLRAPAVFQSPAFGINSTDRVNVHSLVVEVPISELSNSGTVPTDMSKPSSTIGVWTTASRQKARIYGGPNGETSHSGPYVQVSRLGNPLVNELLIPLAKKDLFNASPPVMDRRFASQFTDPGLARLLPSLYAGVFPHLAAYNAAGHINRADIAAILLTGIPAGVISAVPSYSTYTGPVQAEMLRLNLAIPPATSPNNLGLLGGDIAGFPNGRRVFDDVATIELRAVAGATLGLTDPSFMPDAAAGPPFATAGYVNFGLTNSQTDLAAGGTEHYLTSFPYLATPHRGFEADTPAAAITGGATTGPFPASGS
ncbi:MAG: DUF4331 domain-containing protein [Actinomycetota bacterium]|nr:DUF4331 domain-containing protein [Actinomycetota bacterium]